ncbi:diguanylate cyclase [Paenibacillus sp. BR2-3]|uniref:GGDEF domain-containing protein n=1 Tax=Paenibacillus sp. BR2-3 TaxID=3048494 RepID=UPI00397741F6
MLLPDSPLAQAAKAGEQIRSAVEKDSFSLPSGIKVQITVSIGAASYPETVPQADGNLLNYFADQELYLAKNTGRNKVSVAELISAAN